MNPVVKDPYETLGVAKTASADDIRQAYRRLAKKLHPDLHPGDKTLEDRFKDVSIANALLSDAAQRKRYDEGEIDASGTEKPPPSYYRDHAANSAHAYENPSGFQDFAGADDLFAEIFRRQGQSARKQRGADLNYRLTIEFLEAVLGATKRIVLPGGGSLDVQIPAGITEGKTLRLAGKGAPGQAGGQGGDALIEVSILAHRDFTRVGNDVHLELPLTITEAVLGASIRVPTAHGAVMVRVPKGSNTGSVMRLRGKGVITARTSGDEIITLKVMLPLDADPALEKFLTDWKPHLSYDPRKAMTS